VPCPARGNAPIFALPPPPDPRRRTSRLRRCSRASAGKSAAAEAASSVSAGSSRRSSSEYCSRTLSSNRCWSSAAPSWTAGRLRRPGIGPAADRPGAGGGRGASAVGRRHRLGHDAFRTRHSTLRQHPSARLRGSQWPSRLLLSKPERPTLQGLPSRAHQPQPTRHRCLRAPVRPCLGARRTRVGCVKPRGGAGRLIPAPSCRAPSARGASCSCACAAACTVSAVAAAGGSRAPCQPGRRAAGLPFGRP
jgi:hypothetical protein